MVGAQRQCTAVLSVVLFIPVHAGTAYRSQHLFSCCRHIFVKIILKHAASVLVLGVRTDRHLFVFQKSTDLMQRRPLTRLFIYFLLLSIPSFSNRIVPLRFQAGSRRKRLNLNFLFFLCVYFVLSVFLS